MMGDRVTFPRSRRLFSVFMQSQSFSLAHHCFLPTLRLADLTQQRQVSPPTHPHAMLAEFSLEQMKTAQLFCRGYAKKSQITSCDWKKTTCSPLQKSEYFCWTNSLSSLSQRGCNIILLKLQPGVCVSVCVCVCVCVGSDRSSGPPGETRSTRMARSRGT